MTFTGLTLHYAKEDLAQYLPARFQKIQQLSSGQWLFQMKGSKAFKWYVDITPQHARTHRTQLDFPHKEGLSSLAQRMKKWFLNAQCVAITQHGTDRILVAEIKGTDDLFEKQTYYMILEFFGKDANLIITDDAWEILDLYRPGGSVFNHPRVVHIGAHYTWPPKTKASPFDEAAVQAYLKDPTPPVHHVFEGFSKPLGEALKEKAPTQETWFAALNHPNFYEKDGHYKMFGLEPSLPFQTWADGRLKQIFDDKPYDNRLKSLQKTLIKKRDKAIKKVGLLRQEKNDVEKAEAFTLKGQLLMQSPDKHAKKESVTVMDFTTGSPITFTLDPKKTVMAHANDAFKKAKKLKQSIPHIDKQIRLSERLIDDLDAVLDQLNYADAESLLRIYDDLAKAHIIRIPKRKGKLPSAKPKVFTSDNTRIYVGQNHEQNAELTHRFAHKTWWFLHAKNVPGAHVIVASDTPSDATLEAAAQLAAYHSSLRHSPKAEVEITQIKDVKSIKGQLASRVKLHNARTVIVPGDLPNIPPKKGS